jgi:protein-S-isoprenylcysteine O-methyltransferase Ste14
MFTILTFMHVRLTLKEEETSEAEFGIDWRRYAAITPRFFPRCGSNAGKLSSWT